MSKKNCTSCISGGDIDKSSFNNAFFFFLSLTHSPHSMRWLMWAKIITANRGERGREMGKKVQNIMAQE